MTNSRRFKNGLERRIRWAISGFPKTKPLLEMVWLPQSERIPEINIPHGYRLRQYQAEDLAGYEALMSAADMGYCPLTYWEDHILPNGFFVVESMEKEIVAACFASHHPNKRHFRAGNFGWLATDPAHAGRGLGRAVSTAVTRRLIEAGYERIYLETHDHRLPAIRIYLSMGWLPLLYEDEMLDRWRTICEQLDWPFEPSLWKSQIS